MAMVKDAHILRLVQRLGEHYRTNIANRYIRPALMQLSLDKPTWDRIEILTEKFEQFRYQGYELEELYRHIAAAARFVHATRNEIAPTLKYRLTTQLSDADRVMRDMAVNNFSANLQVFADLLHELYTKLIKIDEATVKKGKPVYQQISDLEDLCSRLVGDS